MALDHYVSQVHLRNFYSPELNGKKLFGVQKRSMKFYLCGSEDICRTEEWNTNPYLKEQRIIEEFLQLVEPKYNTAVENFRSGVIDYDSIFALAGFVAYVLSCAPASMRHNKVFLAKTVEVTSKIMDKQGEFPPPPEALGEKSLTKLLETGAIQVEVDGKYSQAIGISGILEKVRRFGNFRWEVLINKYDSTPFFTSDFPIAIEPSDDPRILNRIVPLTPDLAVRIRPNLDIPKKGDDIEFSAFWHTARQPRRQEVLAINRAIVRCAEDQVYFRDNRKWVLPFVKKHAGYWIEPVVTGFPQVDGELILSQFRISQRPHVQ